MFGPRLNRRNWTPAKHPRLFFRNCFYEGSQYKKEEVDCTPPFLHFCTGAIALLLHWCNSPVALLWGAGRESSMIGDRVDRIEPLSSALRIGRQIAAPLLNLGQFIE